MSNDFPVLHQVKVRGFATSEAVAGSLGLTAETVEAVLRRSESEGLLKYREGRITGFSLTPSGREKHAELRDEALTPEARAKITAAYEAFLQPNRDFKQLTTDWQTRDESTETAPLLDRLARLHLTLEGLLATATEGDSRFQYYLPRFTAALTRLREGDASAFARPMSDSYHDVWMELHEDFVSSLGHVRTAADE